MSNNGFGMGGFYRHDITDEFSWTINLAISDVKDETEFEQYDYYGNSYIPGKKNRLLLIPLIASVQYRLFKDDIVDNFRPFVTAGLGPTMVFVAPYASDQIHYDYFGNPYRNKIDFFTSLKYGRPRYTLGGFIGFGAYFGVENGTLTGISVKYFIAPFPDGIEVMYGGYVKNVGGLFITLTYGGMF
jgi:outer membrane protein W